MWNCTSCECVSVPPSFLPSFLPSRGIIHRCFVLRSYLYKHPSFLPSFLPPWIHWGELDWKPVIAKIYLCFNLSRLGSGSCSYGCCTLGDTLLHFRSRLISSECTWTFNLCEIFNCLVSSSLVPRPSSKVVTSKQATKPAHTCAQCLNSPSCGAHSTLPN